MALPNKPKGEIEAVDNPEIVEHKCDVLIVGGGMAACGAAFEIKKWAPDDMKIILVDKSSLERSGAVAQGLSAINTYIGENAIEDYVKMVRNDLMGVRSVRECHQTQCRPRFTRKNGRQQFQSPHLSDAGQRYPPRTDRF